MQSGTETARRRGPRSSGISPRAYEMLSEAWYFGRRARIWDHLVAASGARSGERVLDLGCGAGYFARRIAPVVGPSGVVVGIDPSPASLDYAAAHAPPNCTFYPAQAQNLPFADASFDVVVSSLTFHHIAPDRRLGAIREVLRVLRPRGRACVADVRPPRIQMLERVISAAHGRAEMRNIFNRLRVMITETGFTTIATGSVSRLCYITAERPPDLTGASPNA
ncbi:Demethylrebeccamycin-D-glucose O-methyltransferase [Mycobacterium innocens]|uniref:Demethylrebeccamycin-D-glucose O-methyltransferase n=2 Tax=Mycobacterium innocens TaxID=2341083 RepID=A0A498Q8Y1_9MYCO|nr:Demethylrebeccamycin-D-glucose O-methyltransferase [Mycobacterium innocens]